MGFCRFGLTVLLPHVGYGTSVIADVQQCYYKSSVLFVGSRRLLKQRKLDNKACRSSVFGAEDTFFALFPQRSKKIIHSANTVLLRFLS